jgi:hypothetical protein
MDFILNAECTQKNVAISKVNKTFISHLTRAQRAPSATAAVQVSRALPAVRFSCLLRDQFSRWRRSRKRLSVCSVLRWTACSKPCTKLTLHCNHRSGHLKTENTAATPSWKLAPRQAWEVNCWSRMRNLDSCRCTLCPCKVRNKFLVNFWNCIIPLCMPCITDANVRRLPIGDSRSRTTPLAE